MWKSYFIIFLKALKSIPFRLYASSWLWPYLPKAQNHLSGTYINVIIVSSVSSPPKLFKFTVKSRSNFLIYRLVHILLPNSVRNFSPPISMLRFVFQQFRYFWLVFNNSLKLIRQPLEIVCSSLRSFSLLPGFEPTSLGVSFDLFSSEFCR